MPAAPSYPELAPHMGALRAFLQKQIDAFEPELHGLVTEALAHPGKLLRPTLLFASADNGTRPSDDVVRGAAVVELVHLATLVHDDVLDGADTRHGAETPNRAHGAHAAILFGDALFAHALVLAAELPTPDLCRMVARAAREVCSGEVCQTFSRGNVDLTMADYERHIRLKTAELFAAACRAGAFLAKRSAVEIDSCENFGMRLGVAYQIYDDLVDILQTSDKAGKTLGTDVATGKLTLPLILERQKSGTDAVRKVLSGADPHTVISKETWHACFQRLDAEINAAEAALTPLGDATSANLLKRLSAFLRQASAEAKTRIPQ